MAIIEDQLNSSVELYCELFNGSYIQWETHPSN